MRLVRGANVEERIFWHAVSIKEEEEEEEEEEQQQQQQQSSTGFSRFF